MDSGDFTILYIFSNQPYDILYGFFKQAWTSIKNVNAKNKLSQKSRYKYNIKHKSGLSIPVYNNNSVSFQCRYDDKFTHHYEFHYKVKLFGPNHKMTALICNLSLVSTINLFPREEKRNLVRIYLLKNHILINLKYVIRRVIFSSLSLSRWRIYVVTEGRMGWRLFCRRRARDGVGPHPRVPSLRSRPCSSSSQ